jgi:hypothetical protein
VIISWKNGSNESVQNCYYSEILRKTNKDIVYKDEKKFCDNSLSCNITFENVIAVSVSVDVTHQSSRIN